jgi:hypothetical protein
MILLALAFAYVVAWFIKRTLRRKSALETLAAEIKQPETCGNCIEFDLEEGQAVMQQNPIFLQATQHVPPNTMMRKLDEQGKEVPNEHALRAKENSWQFFGACNAHGQLRHCSDTCEKFQRRGEPS